MKKSKTLDILKALEKILGEHVDESDLDILLNNHSENVDKSELEESYLRFLNS